MRQQRARRARRKPLRHRQIRHAPHQREDRDRELGAHVGEEAQPRAGPQPHGLDAGQRLRTDRRRCASATRAVGVFLTSARVSTIDSTPIAATDTYAVVQPAPVSSAKNGTAESTWPSCPQMPVSCVTRGTCSGENQCGTSRSTEMNVTASPRPTTARAADRRGQRFGEREHQLARRHQAAPETISALEPNRSSSSPAGTCAPA